MRIALSFLILTLCACNTMNIRRHEPLTDKATGQTPVIRGTEYKVHSFAWGFVPGMKPAGLRAPCPGKRIENVRMNMDTPDVLLSVVTLGAYVPHRVTVECADDLKILQ